MTPTFTARRKAEVPASAVSPIPHRAARWLLLAALERGPRAVRAWRRWEESEDLDEVDHGSARLLPLVGWNLRRQGVRARDAGRLRGLHRYWWSQNQLRLRQLSSVAAVLAAGEVPVLALKGVPLVLDYYPDVGLRPMADIDLLVPTGCADRALALLFAAGYTLNEPLERDRGGRVATRRHHAIGLTGPDGRPCDLHWHMLHDCLGDEADRAFWARARTRQVLGQTVRTPAPEDLLLHVCVHGLVANPTPAWRWVADAARILSTCPGFDWGCLVREARRRALGAPLALALECLRRFAPGAPVCEASQAQLAGAARSWLLRAELSTRLEDTHYRYSFAGRLCEWRRRNPDAGGLRRLARLPGFLAETWEVPVWQLPLEGARALGRYLARRDGGPP